MANRVAFFFYFKFPLFQRTLNTSFIVGSIFNITLFNLQCEKQFAIKKVSLVFPPLSYSTKLRINKDDFGKHAFLVITLFACHLFAFRFFDAGPLHLCDKRVIRKLTINRPFIFSNRKPLFYQLFLKTIIEQSFF